MNDTITKLNTFPGLDINNNISIIFFSCVQEIHYTALCKLTEIFEMIENKLIRENPNPQNKRLFYLFHEQKIIN